ncbi:uncharacterized protein DS421_18g626900 [Arachis hypogaea]|nr:uncharacterized protein DS421_18g626900 [Arachis hypogaea]
MLRVRVVSATAKVSEAVIPATGNFGLREKVPVTRLVYVFDESRIWALKSPRVYLVVVVMFCVALVIIYYYLAFIFIHSVRGIGIVLVNVCKIIHIYIYIYIYIFRTYSSQRCIQELDARKAN